MEQIYLYPQVECNTKLDPTKTTLLKVKALFSSLPHLSYPRWDYNSLDGNPSADKIPLAQHLPGDTLTRG